MLRAFDYIATKRVRKSVQEDAASFTIVFPGLGIGLRNKVIVALRDIVTRRNCQVESQRAVVEASSAIQHEAREIPEALANAVQLCFGVG